MKKTLLTLFAFTLFTLFVNAQIVNGNFEVWDNISWEDISDGNSSVHRDGGTASKTTDKQQGNFAIKLETKIANGDTMFGYFIFGDFGDEGAQEGYPYTQKPNAITGYYKCDIKTGDSAGLMVVFMKADTVLSMNMFPLGGTKNSFTQFSFPLSFPGNVSPDSVLIAGVSSNPFNQTAKDGGWIIFDNISFSGAGITQQIPNTDFENWVTYGYEDLNGWYTGNDDIYEEYGGSDKFAVKTTDAYKGTYALEFKTTKIVWGDGSTDYRREVMNFQYGQSNPMGGIVYDGKTIDTLVGYYKYFPTGSDSAEVQLAFKNMIGWGFNFNLPLTATSSYKQFAIPFDHSMMGKPDSVRIAFNSSRWPVDSSNVGSKLIVDEVHWKSKPLNTSIADAGKFNVFRSYPNPASEYFTIEFVAENSSSFNLQITDISGKLVHSSSYHAATSGNHAILLNTSSLAKGMYQYSLKNEDQVMIGTGKLVVK